MNDDDLEVSGVAERLLAFTVDYLLFFLGFMASPRTGPWLAGALAAFCLYQAVFSSGGRATIGKYLLGLRVVGLELEPLSAGKAWIRAVTYLFSAGVGVGFLLALFSKRRQTWHDMVVGSIVVRHRQRGAFETAFVQFAGAACLAALVGVWGWQGLWIPHQRNQRIVGYAQSGLKEMSQLQRSYYARHGKYATDLFILADVSVDPTGFLRDMTVFYGSTDNVRFKFNDGAYRIEALVDNDEKTLVAINGP